MAHVVKTKDLQVGMRVVEPILGKKGDVKVNKGEVLSQLHVDKLKKWKGVDEANPKGLKVESSRASGSAVPDVVDKPWLSPLVEKKAKKNLQSKVAVPAMYDEEGNLLNPSPLERELAQRENERKNNKAESGKKSGRGSSKKN